MKSFKQNLVKPLKLKFSIRNFLLAIYVLVVLGFSASAKAENENINFNKFEEYSILYIGQVVLNDSGKLFLLVSESEVYELRSKLDLSQYLGQVVEITGFDIMYQVKPTAAEEVNLEPLLDLQPLQQKVFPILFVYKISEA